MLYSKELEQFLAFCGKYTDEEGMLTIRALFGEAWDNFFKLPASKTGRFHSEIENRTPGGLANHTMRVIIMATILFDERFAYHAKDMIVERRDLIVAAALHDIGKIDEYKKHGPGAVVKYLSAANENVKSMVYHHMHIWDGTDASKNRYNMILAFADYVASQPYIQIDCITYYPGGNAVVESSNTLG